MTEPRITRCGKQLMLDGRHLADVITDEAAEAICRMAAVLVDVSASLAAAISLLERGGKAAKRAAPSDTMFDIMLDDYRRSLERARTLLEATTHD